jgi:hypothetical protein
MESAFSRGRTLNLALWFDHAFGRGKVKAIYKYTESALQNWEALNGIIFRNNCREEAAGLMEARGYAAHDSSGTLYPFSFTRRLAPSP